MMWSGEVITGSRGSALIERLATKANSQNLELTNAYYERSFHRYEPWMSHVEHRSIWSVLSRKDSSLVPAGDQLIKLRQAFSTKGPLSEISPGNTTQDIGIDNISRQQFEQNILSMVAQIGALSSDYSKRIESLVCEVIPLKSTAENAFRFNGEGLSTQSYRGGVFLKLAQRSPYHDFENVLNFVHELGHTAFNLILNADPIIEDDVEKPVYSTVRKTLRPGVMSLHALAATAYMVEILMRFPSFMRDKAPEDWSRRRFKELTQDLKLGVGTIRTLRTTVWGSRFIRECEFLMSTADSSTPYD